MERCERWPWLREALRKKRVWEVGTAKHEKRAVMEFLSRCWPKTRCWTGNVVASKCRYVFWTKVNWTDGINSLNRILLRLQYRDLQSYCQLINRKLKRKLNRKWSEAKRLFPWTSWIIGRKLAPQFATTNERLATFRVILFINTCNILKVLWEAHWDLPAGAVSFEAHILWRWGDSYCCCPQRWLVLVSSDRHRGNTGEHNTTPSDCSFNII